MNKEKQSDRLTAQQKDLHGISGVVNDETIYHDTKVSNIMLDVARTSLKMLGKDLFDQLTKFKE